MFDFLERETLEKEESVSNVVLYIRFRITHRKFLDNSYRTGNSIRLKGQHGVIALADSQYLY
jgi:hypothetical protein